MTDAANLELRADVVTGGPVDAAQGSASPTVQVAKRNSCRRWGLTGFGH